LKTLQNLVENYLSGEDDVILVTDPNRSFTRAKFREKVYSYGEKLEDMWSILPAISRGIAINLERNSDYLAVIFASWLAHGFYLPLNTSSPERLTKIQIEESDVSLVITAGGPDNAIDFAYISDRDSLKKVTDSTLAYVIFTSGSTGGGRVSQFQKPLYYLTSRV